MQITVRDNSSYKTTKEEMSYDCYLHGYINKYKYKISIYKYTSIFYKFTNLRFNIVNLFMIF